MKLVAVRRGDGPVHLATEGLIAVCGVKKIDAGDVVPRRQWIHGDRCPKCDRKAP
jgi:hypothetical protein